MSLRSTPRSLFRTASTLPWVSCARQASPTLAAAKAKFGAEYNDESLKAEQVVRDAKLQGNQGNLMFDKETRNR